MGKFKDLTGKRFGRWKILGPIQRRDSIYYIKCECECGTKRFVRKTSLIDGTSISCGCWLRRSKAFRKARNIIGKKINRLTIIALLEKKIHNSKNLVALCQCDCGNYYEGILSSIKSEHVKSCGCLNREKLKTLKRHYKGGISSHPLYWKLVNMKERCYNPKNNRYKNYGAKGIKVCKEWSDSVKNFIDWGINNGWQEDLTIDRIDNNGDYCPSNCQWLTKSQNSIKSNLERKNNARFKS